MEKSRKLEKKTIQDNAYLQFRLTVPFPAQCESSHSFKSFYLRFREFVKQPLDAHLIGKFPRWCSEYFAISSREKTNQCNLCLKDNVCLIEY